MPSSARRYKPPRPPGQRVATAQPLAALPLTDAACPLRASGTRGRRNQWNTGDGNTGSAAARDSKRGANQMRPCTPTRSEPPPRDGSIDLAEDPSVPEGQAKSEQAPIRRPPCARRATAPERTNAFLFGPCTARFSFGTTKEKWGVHPGWTSPLREQTPPWPPSGGPSHVTPSGRCAPADSPW